MAKKKKTKTAKTSTKKKRRAKGAKGGETPKHRPPADRSARTRRAAAGSELPAVRVRMYRQGLGDCFLITFNSNDNTANQRHMLIDCGTLGNKSTDATMAKVADSIHDTIDGGQLHIVV